MVIKIVLPGILFLVALVIFIRTLLFLRNASLKTIDFKSNLAELELDPLIPAEHLSAVVKIETISNADRSQNIYENFNALQKQLGKMYPLVHSVLAREVVDGYSLLYTWKGKDPSLAPVAFMAHQDVVPADKNSLEQWTYPPFSGRIADGYVWGRGSIDIKSQLIAIFEAVENLIRNNFQPERTILLAFGHDEEVVGTGVVDIVKHLKEKGVQLQAVLDEGGFVFDSVLPGVKGYSATIGVAEKGYLSLKLKVTSRGGHSSTPTSETAIGILCHAINRLQSHPFPYKVKSVLPMFKALGPAATPLMQIAFANLWLFETIVRNRLLSDPKTAATIHTTTAPTIIHGGVKDNVLPGLVEGVVNFRILPGETIAKVCDRVRRIINDDRVIIEPIRETSREPSPVSPTDSPAYRHLVSLNNEFFADSVSAPFVMLGGTDSYNFCGISAQVYRYTPCVMKKTDLERVHGIDERLSVEALKNMVHYFYRLMERWATSEM